MTTIAEFLAGFGIKTPRVHHNLTSARLVERALAAGEGELLANGALSTRTGDRTGRSPNDRYVVRGEETADTVWWGPVNRPIDREVFDRILRRAVSYLQNKPVFVQDGFAGADPANRLNVRVVAEKAWHALFARTLFLRPTAEQLGAFTPDFTVIDAGFLKLDGAADGIRSDVFVGLDLERRIILVVGTGYGGEIKKSIFAVMNYVLPRRGVLTMHCSANIGREGDTALFFGLSGTGKTTLSADPARRLIGDDEHGWSDRGVFNLEGGCYAKMIKLSREAEPQIYNAIRFGSIIENVVYDPDTREPDYDRDDITENTRGTYPVDFIDNCVQEGTGGHPRDIFFLAADAFGVLPPISRLDPGHAMYQFLSGYTAKLAGTEAGVTEPSPTFSACFGMPFLPLHPTTYADMLAEKMRRHGSRLWLVNTGWSGGPYGVGKRMKIQITRGLLSAALSGQLDKISHTPDPLFGFDVPDAVPGIPTEVLKPRNTWADKDAYDAQARELAKRFQANFAQYAEHASEEIRRAAPRV